MMRMIWLMLLWWTAGKGQSHEEGYNDKNNQAWLWVDLILRSWSTRLTRKALARSSSVSFRLCWVNKVCRNNGTNAQIGCLMLLFLVELACSWMDSRQLRSYGVVHHQRWASSEILADTKLTQSFFITKQNNTQSCSIHPKHQSYNPNALSFPSQSPILIHFHQLYPAPSRCDTHIQTPCPGTTLPWQNPQICCRVPLDNAARSAALTMN